MKVSKGDFNKRISTVARPHVIDLKPLQTLSSVGVSTEYFSLHSRREMLTWAGRNWPRCSPIYMHADLQQHDLLKQLLSEIQWNVEIKFRLLIMALSSSVINLRFKWGIFCHQVWVWLAVTSRKIILFLCFSDITIGRVHLDVCWIDQAPSLPSGL